MPTAALRGGLHKAVATWHVKTINIYENGCVRVRKRENIVKDKKNNVYIAVWSMQKLTIFSIMFSMDTATCSDPISERHSQCVSIHT